MEKALEYYLNAAQKGDVYAQFKLGNIYQNGDIIEKDLSKAVKWFEKAAEQGHPFAQKCLVECDIKEMRSPRFKRLFQKNNSK